MNELNIRSSENTPEIVFESGKGLLSISGISIPENAKLFYSSIQNWIDGFQLTSLDELTVLVRLEYFNTSSSFCLLETFKKLLLLSEIKTVEIIWQYDSDDEDLEEAGREFQHLIGPIFKLEETEKN